MSVSPRLAAAEAPLLNNDRLKITVSPPSGPADAEALLPASPRSITPPLVPLGAKRQPYIPERNSDQFHRMKFYGALERVERRSPAQPHYQDHYNSGGGSARGSPAYGPGGSPAYSPGSPGWGQSPRSFLPPPNVVPSMLYMVGTNRGVSNARGRKPSEHDPPQSRTATVTSLVNTMMGSTIMALPWGFFECGLVGGCVVVAMACCCSFVTAAMVLRRGSRDLDFQHLVRRTLGGNMAVIASFVNVLVMLGASVAYHILMKDCLHVIGSAIIGWSDTPAANPLGPNSTNALTPSYMTANGEFLSSSSFSSAASSAASLSAVPMHHDNISPALAFWNKHGEYAALMVLVAWPLTTLKNLTVLVKFNSLGVFFLFFNIFFMVYQGINVAFETTVYQGVNVTGWNKMMVGNYSSIQDVPIMGSNLWFKPMTFGALAGMSMLAFFVHNAIHPIMRHSNPKTRLCDLGIAYTMVGSLYLLVGFCGALVLPKFAPLCFPTIQSSNCQSFLAMFDPNDLWAFMANCALFMQLFTVFPILLVIIRSEVFGLVGFKKYPPYATVAIVSTVCMSITLSFAIWYPKVGEVLRFTGAGGGLLIVFIIPCLIDSIALCQRGVTGPVDEHKTVTHQNDREIARVNRPAQRPRSAESRLKEGLWQTNATKRNFRLVVNIMLVMMAGGILALQFIE